MQYAPAKSSARLHPIERTICLSQTHDCIQSSARYFAMVKSSCLRSKFALATWMRTGSPS